jgi:hypothetical protein
MENTNKEATTTVKTTDEESMGGGCGKGSCGCKG